MDNVNPIEKVIHLLTYIKDLLEKNEARNAKLDAIEQAEQAQSGLDYVDSEGYTHIELGDHNEPDMVDVENLADGRYNGARMQCKVYTDCTILVDDGIAYALVKQDIV
ncbi:MAG: hypothetical protein K0U41_09870 [Gammaproteobacteria bacterium]|nr:hypothetical protein [Gammaproteobacteria bacterium]